MNHILFENVWRTFFRLGLIMLNNSPPIGAQLAFATHVLDKCFENPHFIFCSCFQNLRLAHGLGG